MNDSETAEILSRPTATASTPLGRSRMAHSQAARTSTACQMCRHKKVKCCGNQPCQYCSKRRLKCVFLSSKKLSFTSQSREQEPNVIAYESQGCDTIASTQPSPSLPMQQSADAFRGDSLPRVQATVYQNSPSILDPRPDTSHSSHPSYSPLQQGSSDKSSPTSHRTANVIAPESSLSSSETFSSEVRTLLGVRSNPASTSVSGILPLPQIDIRNWPTEEEAHSILETVVLNVGISQQLFDVRTFSDNLSLLYHDSVGDAHVPQLWIVEVLLVLAIGRLLQARPDDMSELPGISAIEVLGLAALYLQIVDRKEDAYIHASTALRLATSRGMHRSNSTQRLRRSEAVHCNRLWWTIYMQERRLAAALGHPMSIADDSIHASPPSDLAGFPSATAIAVNVRVARITGQIVSTIYSQKNTSEASFVLDVQSILNSLHEVESTMPAEYSMDFRQSGLHLAGRPLSDSSPQIARTSSSLYLTICQAIIHAVRPVLLYMARNSREREEDYNEPSPTLKLLAEICVKAASKSLVILQELRKQDILAKHAFLDLDAIFSVGFIFVLVEVVNPGKDQGIRGIDGARAILRYLVTLGNHAAGKRLAEIDQMCNHLSLPLQPIRRVESSAVLPQQHSSFTQGYSNVEQTYTEAPAVNALMTHLDDFAMTIGNNESAQQLFNNTDLFNITLEGEDDLYWVYHHPDFSCTGVDQADWETLENQISWT